MTDRESLLKRICEEPQDDTPRLIYADWLDENGEEERAEFVRVQVELARLGPKPTCTANSHCTNPACEKWIQSGGDELRRRELELLKENCWRWFDNRSDDLVVIRSENNILFMGRSEPGRTITEAEVTRGFISSITLSWSDWLAHEAASYWHPEQTVECPKCVALRRHLYSHTADNSARLLSEKCPQCSGTGRIRRPFVATAQPLERVRFSDFPGYNYYTSGGQHSITFANGTRFNRVKCPTCGNQYSYTPCKDCGGTGHGDGRYANEWRCEKWPGIVFEIPEQTERQRIGTRGLPDIIPPRGFGTGPT